MLHFACLDYVTLHYILVNYGCVKVTDWQILIFITMRLANFVARLSHLLQVYHNRNIAFYLFITIANKGGVFAYVNGLYNWF